MQAACGPALAQGPVCTGAFPNLITDVCYDCMFPISLGGGVINIGVSGDDYDTGAGHSPVCLCIQDLSIGTPVGFWEPRYMFDTTDVPGCLPLLGGISITPPYNAADETTWSPGERRVKSAAASIGSPNAQAVRAGRQRAVDRVRIASGIEPLQIDIVKAVLQSNLLWR